jgi:outer membrane protein assembly factor BamB
MHGFEIVLGTQQSLRPSLDLGEREPSAPTARLRLVTGAEPSVRSRPGLASIGARGRRTRETIDIFVGGVNVTARVEADQAPCVLRDLALVVLDLIEGRRMRAVVRFYDTPWELGLCRVDGPHAPRVALSVVRTGEGCEVAVTERQADLAEVIVGTSAAIAAVLGAHEELDPALGAALAAAKLALDGAVDLGVFAPPAEVLATVDADSGARVSFGAELPLRVHASRSNDADGPPSEVADLHALLGSGHLRVVVRGREKDLGELHPFLAAEQLVELGAQVLEAWERARPLHVRRALGRAASESALVDRSAMIGVRLDEAGALALTVGAAVFPSLEGPDLVDGIVTFGRALVRAVLRRDRSQSHNLRLSALKRRVRELSDRLREVARPAGPFGASDLVNAARASYQPYVQPTKPGKPASELPLRKLRYEARWTATVPGIDLRATFLCGDRLILSSARETACVQRDGGEELWKVPTVRATSLPTAGGLARLRGDGKLELRDFGDGSVVWTQPCAPRSKGTPAACTIVAPGLPRLLVATDGDRHLVAFDLTSGEPRWRHALVRPGPIRIRRAGRLLVVSSDESQLVALDAIDGRVVWRVRDRLRFAAPVAIEREDLVAIAGEPGAMACLHVIDALSGARRWERPIHAPIATELAPMMIGGAIVIVTRDRRGLGLLALDRQTGVELWSSPTGTWAPGSSALAIDEMVVVNAPTGEAVALAARDGRAVWRHLFDAPLSGDAPRKLEPVLRSGALFLPQDKVRVLRPSDGAILGVVGPCDLVPDLLRVDERCDVYLAEESGHVAAFGASQKPGEQPGLGVGRARLSLVKSS